MKERDVWETEDNDFLVYICMAGVGISAITKGVWCGDDELLYCWSAFTKSLRLTHQRGFGINKVTLYE